MSILDNPIFHNDDAAREHLEALRWANGVVCPHCGVIGNAKKMEGKSHRKGVYKCRECRKPFSVTVGTIFERSHVPLHKWMLAVYLLSSSKKGFSAHQLHRTLEITYKSAWFMFHRIREVMREGSLGEQMGGMGRIVEVDETYWGNSGKQRKGARGYAHKEKVLSLVERNGKARSFHVPDVKASTLKPILREQIAKETSIMTDEAGQYKGLAKDFQSHDVVCHSIGEYVRGSIYTNTIENYFSIMKRGLKGIYQHVSPKHLRRYLCEYDFRYNSREISDKQRMELALQGIEGKRLMYRDSLRVSC